MLRYGIIGSGMMGQEHIRNVKLLSDTCITAIADPNPEMRQSALEMAGGSCRGFETAAELVAADCCDALILAAPNHLHFNILSDILKTDMPILAEKPLCTRLDDCLEVVRLSKIRTAPVVVAMEYRYMPPVQRLLAEVKSRTPGTLKMLAIREHRFPFLKKVGDWNRFNRNSGGTLVEKCCHYFDLMRLITGGEPVRIYASAGMDVNHLDEVYDGETPDIIDNAFVVVDFDNGVRSLLDLCMFAEGSYWQEVISVTGDSARVDAMIPGPSRFSPDGKERASQIVISDRKTKRETTVPIHVDQQLLAAGDHHGSTYFQHKKFQNLILHGGTPEVTVGDGMLAVAMGIVAQESAMSGEARKFNIADYR